MTHPTMTKTEAEAAGLRCIWGESREPWMINNVCADMRRGGITHAVVEHERGYQVWRSLNGMKEDK